VNKKRALVLFVACTALMAAPVGCSSKARAYAQEARSSYITARAVLVGVEEFPAQMETLLRSGDVSAMKEEAEELIEYIQELLPSAASAFRTVKEDAELLKGEGSDKYDPYADLLLELVSLNEQVINAYSEFIGLSNSVLQGLPYGQDPEALMPTLNYMDAVIQRIQELDTQIQRLEEEAETLYIEI
jgi:uncharacterized protein YlzI (FlbEa/FlbD family)